MKKRKPERNNFSAYRKGAEQKSSAPFLFHSHIIRKTHIEFIKQSSYNGGVITVDREKTSLNILKFILFALIFVVVGIGICTLWSFIGKLAVTGIDDVLASPEKELPVIIIDAGHGGIDGGAVGCGSVSEKDLNLDIALRLSDILSAAGIPNRLTRSEDIMLESPGSSSKKNGDLAARKKIAESYENAVFVSIHMNSFPIAKYNGLQVYYSQNNDKSYELANLIQTDIAERLQPENKRKTKAATSNIYLLNNLSCPAVLVECGFLSNPEECERLATEEYRREIALSLACSVCEYIYGNTP